MALQHAYAKISGPSEDEDLELEPVTMQDQEPSCWSHLSRYLTVRNIILSSLGFTVFLLVAKWSTSPSLPSRLDLPLRQCGSTPEEARSLGCRFEMHNFAWVPPACYDEELSSEWNSFQDWGFSRSKNDGNDTDPDFIAQCRTGNMAQAWVPWWCAPPPPSSFPKYKSGEDFLRAHMACVILAPLNLDTHVTSYMD